MRIPNLACLLLALLLQLSACGRPEATAQPPTSHMGALNAPISNPWMAPPALPPELPAIASAPTAAPAGESLLPALSSANPHARLAGVEAWVQSRPDSLHEIKPMLHDSDPAVRTRARVLWNAALSGGRKSDPE